MLGYAPAQQSLRDDAAGRARPRSRQRIFYGVGDKMQA